MQESELSSWRTPRTQCRDRESSTGERQGNSSWASKELLHSQAGQNGFQDHTACLLWRRGLLFLNEHFRGVRARKPPFSGKRRIEMLIISMLPSFSSTLITIRSSLASPSPQLQKHIFKRLFLETAWCVYTERRQRCIPPGEIRR